MRIKNFSDFSSDLNESSGYSDSRELGSAEGKTAFSRWLRGINQRLKYQVDSRGPHYDWSGSHIDTMFYSRKAKQAIPNFFRLITGAGAAIADFFTPSKKSTKIPKDEIKKSKKAILDDWEKREIGDKKVSDSDAENFYRSGVLKGQRYFGPEFNPSKPRNNNEEAYTDYLNDAMKRYYDKISPRRK